MTNPPRPPAETLGNIIKWLVEALDGPSMFGSFPRAVAQPIISRLFRILRQFKDIAARVQAGKYVPRPAAATRERHAPGRHRQRIRCRAVSAG